jgi:hypothetical protein
VFGRRLTNFWFSLEFIPFWKEVRLARPPRAPPFVSPYLAPQAAKQSVRIVKTQTIIVRVITGSILFSSAGDIAGLNPTR